MTEHYDLAVIGGGPAGLAAAAVAAEAGADVALFDEQPRLGGQIYRDVAASPLESLERLGPDYARGHGLVDAFRHSKARHFPQSQIWLLTPEREIGVLADDKARLVSAARIVIAAGAMERPVPFPGWTLPGVMTAGAAQILLKSAGQIPRDGVVLAGVGPLLYLIAAQFARYDVRVQAVLDMADASQKWAALPRLGQALAAGNYVGKGLALKREIRAAGIPLVEGVTALRAVGNDALQAVEYRRDQHLQRLEAPLLLVHFGVIPNGSLTSSLGCRHDWDAAQVCWRPATNAWGDTDVNGVAVAGDCRGIYGALAAELEGRLAGLEAARALGRIDAAERDWRAKPDQTALARDRRVRPFLETLFRPPDRLLADVDDDTVVCRCEEITARQIRAAVAEGCRGPNQVKAYTRCGMGPCQGRQCGPAACHMIAAALGVSVVEVGTFRPRPPVKPITLAQLASLDDSGTPP